MALGKLLIRLSINRTHMLNTIDKPLGEFEEEQSEDFLAQIPRDTHTLG